MASTTVQLGILVCLPLADKDVTLVLLLGLLSLIRGLISAASPVPAQWKQRGGFGCALKRVEVDTFHTLNT